MTNRHDVRASDAERDSAAAALREHFVQGRLTLEELMGRLDSALTARMRSQLDSLLADLPSRKERSAVRQPEPEPVVFPARYAAVAILIIVMAVWLVLAAWFSQRGYGYGYGGYPPH